MSQIIKKFIGDDQVDGAKLLLENNQAFRAVDNADVSVDLMKLDDSNKFLALKSLEASATTVYLGSEAKPFGHAYSKSLDVVSDSNVAIGGMQAIPLVNDLLIGTVNNLMLGATETGKKIMMTASEVSITAPVVINSGGTLKLQSESNTRFNTFKTSDSATADVNYILPYADGSDGQFLKTNGSGQLAWTSPAAQKVWAREVGNIDGSNQVTLGHAPIAESLIVFVDGVMMRYGVDYEVDSGAPTKLNFNLGGAAPPIVAADDIYIQYQY